MTRRRFVMAVCLVLSVTAGVAQERDKTADPITGTWNGELKRQDDTSKPAVVTFELKFDGTKAVTGTFTGLDEPGDVKAGTFNADSGALKLDLGKLDGPAVLIVLEGKVSKGEALGTVKAGNETGTFKLIKK